MIRQGKQGYNHFSKFTNFQSYNARNNENQKICHGDHAILTTRNDITKIDPQVQYYNYITNF